MVWQGDEQRLLCGCTGSLCFELRYQDLARQIFECRSRGGLEQRPIVMSMHISRTSLSLLLMRILKIICQEVFFLIETMNALVI